MQVQIETVGALERRMTVKIPAQRVEDEVESRLKSLSRTARIKGFRPGKVPFKVVVQNYGPQVRTEVLNELLRQTWGEAVVQQKLNPAGGPKLEPLKVEPGKDLEYSALFEVYPEVTLKGLDALKVEKPVTSASAAPGSRPRVPRAMATAPPSISKARSTASRSPATRASSCRS